MENWQSRIGKKFTVRVTTGASENKILVDEIKETLDIRVYVTAIPEHGKANKAVTKLLAKFLKIPASKLRIIHGEHHRMKTFIIE